MDRYSNYKNSQRTEEDKVLKRKVYLYLRLMPTMRQLMWLAEEDELHVADPKMTLILMFLKTDSTLRDTEIKYRYLEIT